MHQTLIKNANIITMDPDLGDLAAGDILISDGVIEEVGTGLAATDAELIDAGGMIVLPGLINAHLHTWMTALRGLGGNWAGYDFFRIVHKNLSMLYTPEDSYLSTLMGSLNQLDCGTTTIFEWCHNNKTPEHSDASIEALFDSGIRAVFGHGTVKPKQKEGEPHFSEIPHPRALVERLRQGRLCDDKARITLAICILGPDYAIEEVTLKDFRLAKELDILSSAHIWGREDRRTKKGYFLLAQENLLGPNHNLAHGNYLKDDELKLIVDNGVSVTTTPFGELQKNPVPTLIGRVRDIGGKPSLGSDHEINTAGDMLAAMRYALQTQRIFDNLTSAAAGQPVEQVSLEARHALEWATINNAWALRLEDRIGSLTPGKQADLIMLRTDGLNLVPAHDPIMAVVFYANSANVDTVMVAGRKVKAGGKLLFDSLKFEHNQEKLLASGRRLLRDGSVGVDH
jgi:cytosine/adenosine deaminase-related metal-dependent hydrolase